MKLRNPWLIKLAGLLASWLIRLWMGTLRYQVANLGDDEHPADVRARRFLYAFWHEAMLFPTAFRAKVHILISHHADGELIAQTCRHLGAKVVRGSSNRGGAQALLQLFTISKSTHLLVTPDGPRGPRRRVQLGLIFLASHTGLPVIPCGVAYRQAWRARSWDRFAVPRPGTTAYGVFGAAVVVPAKLDRKGLEKHRDLVEQRMLEVTAAAERWARGGPRPAPSPHPVQAPPPRVSA
jgi:lysophospholipid acyltransferase (LPLAT)-like uncharacterized protein